MGKREQKFEICSFYELQGHILHGAITSTTALHVSILAAMQTTVSEGIHSSRRDLILEPLAGSCYHESGFLAGNLMASWTYTSGITGYLASHSGLLAMAFPVAANLQICKEAKG